MSERSSEKELAGTGMGAAITPPKRWTRARADASRPVPEIVMDKVVTISAMKNGGGTKLPKTVSFVQNEEKTVVMKKPIIEEPVIEEPVIMDKKTCSSSA